MLPEIWFRKHRPTYAFNSICKSWTVVPFPCGSSLLTFLDVGDELVGEMILKEVVELLSSRASVALEVDRIPFFVEVPLRF